MRIAFDGTSLTPGRTGVGYYTEHLLQHLAREVEQSGDEIVVISNKPIDTQRPLPRHVREPSCGEPGMQPRREGAQCRRDSAPPPARCVPCAGAGRLRSLSAAIPPAR